jgi:hypothetical protein
MSDHDGSSASGCLMTSSPNNDFGPSCRGLNRASGNLMAGALRLPRLFEFTESPPASISSTWARRGPSSFPARLHAGDAPGLLR